MCVSVCVLLFFFFFFGGGGGGGAGWGVVLDPNKKQMDRYVTSCVWMACWPAISLAWKTFQC